ncbi:LysR family transcriptional regulator [Micromonospora craniellae]|uniref:LysR family transcriptional regulator n=1 Tax=Micromonospora craniellae TaxID=2294034 RepID=A0A372G155_9ACTN|nr:LysR family transcriptional regulator [Micromonospora craniellae]QOC91616.1 LysR family transcriptional regulator [Micromonospora craniellae]RFS46604.1 LysR family transcriptional regulator [Micromonospora craniellae]
MELRQLEYFVAVAEEANFTRAAERVRISQSGVSAQIRGLERELGATLFDRSTRTATLTDAGRAALAHARAALACADAVRQAVDDVTGLVRGSLTVGMVTGCTVTPFFEALAAFHRAHPAVEITLVEETSVRLLDAVRSGAVDLALVGTADATAPGLNTVTVVSERLVALVPPEHPLANRTAVALADLAAYRLVCMPEGTGIRTVLDRACLRHGVRPTIAVQASAADAIADLAARGLGVAVLSESMTGHYESRLTALRIDDVDEPARLALAWSATPGPALDRLVAHCRDALPGSRR